jgi:chorismate mutase
VVYFIVDRTHEDTLEGLRSDLLLNTLRLTALFRERMNIARRIFYEKSNRDIPVRDRLREIYVLREMGNLSREELGFVDLLFELTVQAQAGIKNSGEETVLERSSAEFICGEIIFSPGDEVYYTGEEKYPLVTAAISRGAHIIRDDSLEYDLMVKIKHQERGFKLEVTGTNGRKLTMDEIVEMHPFKKIKLEVA